MKVLTIFGTRPEAIKMAILVRALNESFDFEHRLCVTAQHRELLDQVLEFFEIQPHYDLNLMKTGQDLTDITSRVLLGIRPIFKDFRPDMVLVHGDTTTCFASTLAAFYHRIPIGHIEAGLRTGNLFAPFPEEANRVLTGRLATLHFAPTNSNLEKLMSEGIPKEKIVLTGNTVIDSLLFASEKVSGFSTALVKNGINEVFQEDRRILLITGHRRENFGRGFVNICEALKILSRKYPKLHMVYPVHMNPNVQKPVMRFLDQLKNVHLLPPLSYPDFVLAMKKSWAILTDSGGVQEEAPSLGKPVVVMRDQTERQEAVAAGTVILVGTTKEKIVNTIVNLMEDSKLYDQMSKSHNPYGDGLAVQRILSRLRLLDGKF